MLEEPDSRWAMVKKLIFFQVKLAFDAGRDLLLSPVSIICVLIDIIRQPPKEQSQFTQLMKLGHQTDLWLNLFNHSHPKKQTDERQESQSESITEIQQSNLPDHNADQLFEKIDSVLTEQLTNGKLTEGAKNKLRQYLKKPPIANDDNSN